MNKISIPWMCGGRWKRCPLKVISLTDSLACYLCGDP